MNDATETAEGPESKQRKRKSKDREWQIERGVAIRAGFYIFGTHLFAGFVWLLFYLGEHAHK
ncbi:DUF6126 family protein [Streptomyces sp. NBC_01613]|uniref:DUF6126 family protein n=1 Tax=Streptomyces sp. NBC_01613 TaxID=2975896 RepID=UPI0038706048